MDKERIDGFRSAFAPGETLFWQVPAAARERMAFYSENLPRLFSEKITAVFAVSDHYALEFMRFLQGQGIRRLEALRDGTPCDAGIVLPVELRRTMDIAEKDPLEIYVDGNSIVLRKYRPSCIFCDSTKDVRTFRGKNVCPRCLRELRERT